MKKLVSILLAIVLLLSLSAPAEETVNSGDYTYRLLPDGAAEITEYRGKAKSLDIPSQLDGHTVTSIGESAFVWCNALTSVTIPEGVTTISDYAFSNCSGLTSVIIPDSVKEIGANPFEGCEKLTAIKVSPEHEYLAVTDGALVFKPDMRLLSFPMNKQGEYAIPQGIREIGESAFSGCDGLTSVTIPESVTSIGDSAFYNCIGLTSVTIPEGVTSIGNSAFSSCSGLTSVTIPSSVTSMGNIAFSKCSGLTSVTIPEGVTSIGEGAFAECADELTLTVQRDSCAVDYCRENELNYTYPDSLDWLKD